MGMVKVHPDMIDGQAAPVGQSLGKITGTSVGFFDANNPKLSRHCSRLHWFSPTIGFTLLIAQTILSFTIRLLI